MSYYETLYIVHPALESGRLKDIILSLEESLKNLGGKTISIDLWGKKKLAYIIDKQKYGTYVKFQFTGEGNCTSSFGMELEHNPNILQYLTTLIEESDVVEQKNDLDTQIAGHSREALRIDNSSKNEKEQITSEKSKLSEAKDEEGPVNLDDSKKKLELEEDTSEKNINSVEENEEKAVKTTTGSEEE